MKKVNLAAVVISFAVAGLAYAQADQNPIAMRQGAMQANGLLIGTLAGMAKGDTPFDADKVNAALEGMHFVANSFGNYFPQGSVGGDSETSPKVWDDAAGFQAALTKWQGDVASVVENMPTDQASLGAALGTIGGNCKSCHEAFRVKK